jgi:hypothetical protein
MRSDKKVPPPGGKVRRWLTDRIVGQLRSIRDALSMRHSAAKLRLPNDPITQIASPIHAFNQTDYASKINRPLGMFCEIVHKL